MKFPKFTVLLLIAATAAGANAQAGQTPGATTGGVKLSIKPVDHPGTFFQLTMSAGEKRSLQLEIANLGTRPVKADTFAADVYSIVNGGLGARLKGEPRTGATEWVDYPETSPTLQPLRPVRRSFTLTIPAGTEPGEYITSLILQSSAPVRGSSGLNLNQVQRQAMAISIKIPGPEQARLDFGKARHLAVAGKSVVSVEVANAGNTHLRPTGNMTIDRASGEPVNQARVAMDSVYAGTRTNLEKPLDRLLKPGRYVATVTLRDASKAAAADSGRLEFTVPPRAASGPRSLAENAQRRPRRPLWANPVTLIIAAVVLVVISSLATVLVIRSRKPG